MNSSIRFRSDLLIVLTTFFLLLVLSSTLAFALEIKIHEKALVRNDQIMLGNIASFSPPDDERVQTLEKIIISASPTPGSIFRINERLLINKIDPFVIGYDDIRIMLPENLRVRRSAQYMNSEEFKTIFRDYVMDHSPYPEDKVVIDRITAPNSIPLPEGKLTWSIQDKDNEDFVGNISLTLDLNVDNELVRKVPLSGILYVNQAFLKTTNKIRKGDIITEDDVVLANETKMHLRSEGLTNMESIVGKRAVRNINADKIITQHMVEYPPVVKKGSGVMIKAENEDIRITTRGKVMEDGHEGDQVKVMNISSGKEIFAIVKGPGVVEVNF